MVVYDAIVIGAGPAGICASIYLKRANLNILVIDSSVPGGQINRTSLVENYLGFSKIDGPSLAAKMYQQLLDNKIEYKYGEVINIKDGNIKTVVTNKEEIKTKNIIIATGRKPKELGLDNEKTLIGRGISFCAACDGFFFKDKIVSVVGGGNSALEEALYLASLAKEVNLIHRREEFRADAELVEKVKDNKKIKLYLNDQIQELVEEEGVLAKIKLTNKTIDTDGLFIFIGSTPNLSFINNLDIKVEEGYLVVDEGMRTSIPGIYACGDIIKKEYYQISTAVGEGAIAALSLKKDFK
jgi:thioredoxin reductase (NADPH)